MLSPTDARPSFSNDVGQRYIDLLAMCLTRDGFPEHWRPPTPEGRARQVVNRCIQGVLRRARLELVRPVRLDLGGIQAHPEAETMVGRANLGIIERCIRSVCRERIPGDLIETGVWRGGAVVFMRAMLSVLGDRERVVWAADSFQGLPEPDADLYPADCGDTLFRNRNLAISLEEVKQSFSRYGLLDQQVRFLKGWFKDTLPTAPIDHLALLRMDGDMYESTMDALSHLYPKLSVGGYAIVDDFHLAGARQATLDYRQEYGIEDEIVRINSASIYWRRSS